jgi:hypothetical protein
VKPKALTRTPIEWTTLSAPATTPPAKPGWHCEHASEEYRLYYAETLNRFRGTGLAFARQNRHRVEVFLDEDRLNGGCRPSRQSSAADRFRIRHRPFASDRGNGSSCPTPVIEGASFLRSFVRPFRARRDFGCTGEKRTIGDCSPCVTREGLVDLSLRGKDCPGSARVDFYLACK